MKIGFTGTREGMTDRQWKALYDTLSNLVINEAHHGDCVGADAQFSGILRGWPGVRIVSHPADMPRLRAFTKCAKEYPPKPPLDRNRDIVDASDVLFATPKEMTEQDRGGTWYTIHYAAKTGKPVWIILPDGEIVRGASSHPSKQTDPPTPPNPRDATAKAP